MNTRLLLPIALAVAVAVVGCGQGKPSAERTTLNAATLAAASEPAADPALALSSEAETVLSEANTSYMNGDYETALTQYRKAAEMAPENGAPWYGVGMAARKLNRPALADSASKRLETLIPELAEAAHPESAETAATPASPH